MKVRFKAKLWIYSGQGAWHFVTLPRTAAKTLREDAPMRRGFGSVKVSARIGKTVWKTSVFPDSKSKSFLLPVKADVRKKESLREGTAVSVELEVDVSIG